SPASSLSPRRRARTPAPGRRGRPPAARDRARRAVDRRPSVYGAASHRRVSRDSVGGIVPSSAARPRKVSLGERLPASSRRPCSWKGGHLTPEEGRYDDLTAFLNARGAALLQTAVFLAPGRQSGEDLLQEALERLLRKWHKVSDPEGYV